MSAGGPRRPYGPCPSELAGGGPLVGSRRRCVEVMWRLLQLESGRQTVQAEPLREA